MADIKIANILLVEDNEGDVLLTKEALTRNKFTITLNIVKDGIEAMKYLYKEDEYADKQYPDLILLDLNLPKQNGCEVLADIKKDPVLRSIPVVIMTSSRAEVDILKTYNLHANCYVQKPLDFKQFITVVQSIEDFWFTIVRLPSKTTSSIYC